jgi:hypothetical protein
MNTLARCLPAALAALYFGGTLKADNLANVNSLFDFRATTDSSKASIGMEAEFSSEPMPVTSKVVDRLNRSERYKNNLIQVNEKTLKTFSLKSSVPIKKGSDTTTFASLDGFQNAFTTEAVFTSHSAMVSSEALILEPRTYWGISAAGAFQEFEYLATNTLEKKRTKELTPGISLFWLRTVSLGTNKPEMSFRVGYDFKKAFKDSDTKGFTLPADPSGRSEVRTGPYGEPTKNDSSAVTFEVRSFAGSYVGIGAKLLYDFEKDAFGIAVPILFVKNDKFGASGGIEFAWREDTSKFTIGVVVGKIWGLYQ